MIDFTRVVAYLFDCRPRTRLTASGSSSIVDGILPTTREPLLVKSVPQVIVCRNTNPGETDTPNPSCPEHPSPQN